jgi:hypothetical protein
LEEEAEEEEVAATPLEPLVTPVGEGEGAPLPPLLPSTPGGRTSTLLALLELLVDDSEGGLGELLRDGDGEGDGEVGADEEEEVEAEAPPTPLVFTLPEDDEPMEEEDYDGAVAAGDVDPGLASDTAVLLDLLAALAEEEEEMDDEAAARRNRRGRHGTVGAGHGGERWPRGGRWHSPELEELLNRGYSGLSGVLDAATVSRHNRLRERYDGGYDDYDGSSDDDDTGASSDEYDEETASLDSLLELLDILLEAGETVGVDVPLGIGPIPTAEVWRRQIKKRLHSHS